MIQPSLPIRPMDDRPIEYPLARPASLSSDALLMYRYGRRLNRDLFEPGHRSRYVSPEEAKAFQPTERMLAAIKELVDAKLATHHTTRGHELALTRVHERYTVAFGRGSQLIMIKTFNRHPEDAELLAVLVGGDLEKGYTQLSAGMSEIVVRSRHDNATDDEHDASSSALLTIRNLTQPSFSGYGAMTFQGVLVEARLYDLGADPVRQNGNGTRVGEICTECSSPHPFAPFLPPNADWLTGPTFVIVEAYPFRPFLAAGPPPTESETR
ncbi:hypothetical protein ANMWB30_23020 [Arthrobacter sp. MWB30]|nr:hypothetical protein ANMWB30_23020 [Arthrobacter sp. MWB30]